MKRVRWPLPEDAKKIALASVPKTLPTVNGKDLYQLAKQKRKDDREMEHLQERLMTTYI
jgi:hypothetical protein